MQRFAGPNTITQGSTVVDGSMQTLSRTVSMSVLQMAYALASTGKIHAGYMDLGLVIKRYTDPESRTMHSSVDRQVTPLHTFVRNFFF